MKAVITTHQRRFYHERAHPLRPARVREAKRDAKAALSRLRLERDQYGHELPWIEAMVSLSRAVDFLEDLQYIMKYGEAG